MWLSLVGNSGWLRNVHAAGGHVVINGYVVYRGNVYTEERIYREMRKVA